MTYNGKTKLGKDEVNITLNMETNSFEDLSGKYEIKIDHAVHVLMPSKNINTLFIEDKK